MTCCCLEGCKTWRMAVNAPQRGVPPATPQLASRGGRFSGVHWWPDLGVHRGWEPYRKTLRAYVPEADQKIAFDKFHIMHNVNTDVDTVRKHGHRTLAASGASPLTRTKYAWLRNPATFSATAWREFAALRTSTLQTAKAWAMKESLRHL
jgi:hypothetical protein